MINMKEEQVVTKTELEYSPVIFYCQHQTAPFPARIWIPPFADPISSNISPLCAQLAERDGHEHGRLPERAQDAGRHLESRFDNWYRGLHRLGARVPQRDFVFYGDGAVRYATPHFYTVDEFPKEYQDLRALSHVLRRRGRADGGT